MVHGVKRIYKICIDYVHLGFKIKGIIVVLTKGNITCYGISPRTEAMLLVRLGLLRA